MLATTIYNSYMGRFLVQSLVNKKRRGAWHNSGNTSASAKEGSCSTDYGDLRLPGSYGTRSRGLARNKWGYSHAASNARNSKLVGNGRTGDTEECSEDQKSIAARRAISKVVFSADGGWLGLYQNSRPIFCLVPVRQYRWLSRARTIPCCRGVGNT